MSLSIKGAVSWAGGHPFETGIGVFAVGLAVLWALGFFKPSGASSGTEANGSSTALDSAYLQATGEQSSAQAATQIAGINANAATAQAQIGSQTTLGVQQLWADQEEQVGENSNQFQLNMGELALDQQENQVSENNAADQYGLNIINSAGGLGAYEALVNSGYYATH